MKDRIFKDLKWIKVDSSPYFGEFPHEVKVAHSYSADNKAFGSRISSPYYWALSPKSKLTKLHKGNNRLNSTQNS